jgi:two-component system sensor kinase FixL
MKASPPPFDLIDGIPAQELLEGLGHLHQWVVVTSPDGTVLWMSRALARAIGGQHRGIGLSLVDLCRAYVTPRTEIEAQPDVEQQIGSVIRHLGQHESLCNYEFVVGRSDDSPVSLNINAFRVESVAAFPSRFSNPPAASREGNPGQVEGANRAQATKSDPHLIIGIIRPGSKDEGSVPIPRAEAGQAGVDNFFLRVFEQSPDGMMVIDQEGFIRYANANVGDLLGKAPNDLLDKPIALFLPKVAFELSGHDESDPASSTAWKSTRGRSSEVFQQRPAGNDSIWIGVSSNRIRLSDGDRMGRVLQLRDATRERSEIERLQKKNAALEDYVHSVSHDLRTPLVSLLGFTRLLKHDYEGLLDKSGKHFLDRIEEAGSAMNMLIRDLLELSTAENNVSSRDPVDPGKILQQIRAELKPRLEERGATLELPTQPPMLYCDRTQLYQVFSNLIGNAIQHMGPCDNPVIRVEIAEGSGHQIISIRDNGKGIPAKSHERIFEAFHTLGSRGSKNSTGIGLAIVKKIALAHEGKIWVESEPGHGATFCVSLKRRR